jgi:hypothetical protein
VWVVAVGVLVVLEVLVVLVVPKGQECREEVRGFEQDLR